MNKNFLLPPLLFFIEFHFIDDLITGVAVKEEALVIVVVVVVVDLYLN